MPPRNKGAPRPSTVEVGASGFVLTGRLSLSRAAKVVKDVTQLVLARRTRMCNFLEYKGEPPRFSLPFDFAS